MRVIRFIKRSGGIRMPKKLPERTRPAKERRGRRVASGIECICDQRHVPVAQAAVALDSRAAIFMALELLLLSMLCERGLAEGIGRCDWHEGFAKRIGIRD